MNWEQQFRDLLRLSPARLILTVVLFIYGVRSIFTHGASSSHSPIAWYILFAPLLLGIIGALLLIPYLYVLSSVLILLFQWLNNDRRLLIFGIVLLLLFLGLDEPLVNSTINRPDYSCTVDEDCVVGNPTGRPTCSFTCMNKNWEYYESLASTLAMSCAYLGPTNCTCEQQRCVTTVDRWEQKAFTTRDCLELEDSLARQNCLNLAEQEP